MPSTIFQPENGNEGSIDQTSINFDTNRKVLVIKINLTKGSLDNLKINEIETPIKDFYLNPDLMKKYNIKKVLNQSTIPKIISGKIVFELKVEQVIQKKENNQPQKIKK